MKPNNIQTKSDHKPNNHPGPYPLFRCHPPPWVDPAPQFILSVYHVKVNYKIQRQNGLYNWGGAGKPPQIHTCTKFPSNGFSFGSTNLINMKRNHDSIHMILQTKKSKIFQKKFFFSNFFFV